MERQITDKAVILARGLGTRMRKQNHSADLDEAQAAVADSGVKALIPIGRPFLDYVLSALADAGYRRVCLVIGPDHDVIRNYYGNEVELERLSIEFAIQEEPKGTADAVLAAEAFSGGDPIAVLNSDNYYPVEVLRTLRETGGAGVGLFDSEAMIAGSNIPAERLAAFAVAELEDGNLVRILEKPSQETLDRLPRPLWISMNCWQLPGSIFESCRAIEPSPRGEYELPDAVNHSMAVLGEVYKAAAVAAPVLDMSCRDDIAGVKEKLEGVEVQL